MSKSPPTTDETTADETENRPTTNDETDTGKRTDTRRRHRHPSPTPTPVADTAEKRRCADCRRDLVESLFPGDSAVCRDCATEEGGA